MDIVDKKFGDAEIDVKLEGGKIIISESYDLSGGVQKLLSILESKLPASLKPLMDAINGEVANLIAGQAVVPPKQ